MSLNSAVLLGTIFHVFELTGTKQCTIQWQMGEVQRARCEQRSMGYLPGCTRVLWNPKNILFQEQAPARNRSIWQVESYLLSASEVGVTWDLWFVYRV